MILETFLPTEQDTLAFGARLVALCPKQCTLFLQGELGAGKTTLVRGCLQALGYQGIVKSPTYTLVETYDIQDRRILHFDLYRLKDPEELAYIGIADYFAAPSICLIEWPERAKNQLPPADLTCYIRALHSGRGITLTAESEGGRQILLQWNDA
jgi:tRNA threonylcarbamoyladenosine biosynthesis protein TsaE